MSDENEVSRDASRFIAAIAAAKLGKQSDEHMWFELTTFNGKTFTFDQVESGGDDWLILSLRDSEELYNVRASYISDWSIQKPRPDTCITTWQQSQNQKASVGDLLRDAQEVRYRIARIEKLRKEPQPVFTVPSTWSGAMGTDEHY